MSIYVETLIRAPIDALWRHTQDPAFHQRWDLRFSAISYLPRASEQEAQRFQYETRIGFGAAIRGAGESVGERSRPDGERTSSLKFWSDDPKSLIREGSGYWRYIPTDDGIRFLTWYDYRTRFGRLGRLFNRVVFEPLMGWATAWSFDRLRLWLEQGAEPERSRDRFLIHAACRACLAFVMAYHGVVPKLIMRDPLEFALTRAAGISAEVTNVVVPVAGVAEFLFALLLLFAWRLRWPLVALVVLMPVVAVACAVTSWRAAVAAFNPVTLNACIATLAAVALVAARDMPLASRCKRSPNRGES